LRSPGEVNGLHAPLLMHLAEEDEFISKAAQTEIKTALASKPNATVYSYPGQRHAFSRHNGTHYNAAAAALANGRTSEFLRQQTAVTLPARLGMGDCDHRAASSAISGNA